MLDPGYGFGKRFEENYALLARQAELLALGRPLLAGRQPEVVSGAGAGAAPWRQRLRRLRSRETASVAALAAAILHGASIVRVHDAVRRRWRRRAIADAVLSVGSPVSEARPGAPSVS